MLSIRPPNVIGPRTSRPDRHAHPDPLPPLSNPAEILPPHLLGLVQELAKTAGRAFPGWYKMSRIPESHTCDGVRVGCPRRFALPRRMLYAPSGRTFLSAGRRP